MLNINVDYYFLAQKKTTSIEDNLNGRRPQRKMTLMEDNINGRQPDGVTDICDTMFLKTILDKNFFLKSRVPKNMQYHKSCH